MILLLTGFLLAAHPSVPINRSKWIAADDYPAGALRKMEQGVTGFRLDVSEAGLPLKCEIEHSSGYTDIDAHTCTLMMRRGRFEPATSNDGSPMIGSYSSKATWEMHEQPASPKSN